MPPAPPPAVRPPPALQIENLHLRLGGRAVLDGVTMTVDAAQITALLGANGAGKTSLIRCCSGILTPESGEVTVFGGSVSAAIAAGVVAVMPQSAGAWTGIRPLELLGYLAGLYADPLPVAGLARRLGIDRFAQTSYRRLSGGQQQAVNLAGALIGRPGLVFLDEPTAGMDPHARRSVWHLLDELRSSGVSVLLTTHAMDEAERLADRVDIIDGGRILLSGTPADLTADGRTLEDVFLASTQAPSR